MRLVVARDETRTFLKKGPLSVLIRVAPWLKPGKDAIGLLESFLAANVVPDSANLISLDRFAGVEPLDESARLIRIISSS